MLEAVGNFGQRHPVLRALGIVLLYPAVQMYGIVVDYPRQIKKTTEELKAWQKHEAANADKQSDSRAQEIKKIFNECAAQIKDRKVALVCHNNSDFNLRNEEDNTPKFGNLLAGSAQIGPTTEQDSFVLSVNADFLEHHSDEDIRFILGHELSHLKNGDFERQKKDLKVMSVFNLTVIAGAAALVAGAGPAALAGSLCARIAYGIHNTRKNHQKEYKADKGAVTDFNVSAHAAQFTLVKIDPYSFMSQCAPKTRLQKLVENMSSHPPTHKRIEALESLAFK